MMTDTILFLCDQKKPECCDSDICGTECVYTRDIKHAKNFKKATCETDNRIPSYHVEIPRE